MTDQEPLAPLSYDQVRGWLAMEGALTGPLSWGLINAFRRAVQWDRDQRQAANEAKLQEARGAVPMTNQRPRAQVAIEGTELMRKWLRIDDKCHLDLSPSAHPLSRSPADLMDALKQAAQWGSDLHQSVNEAQLQEARDQQLDECCKWLASNDRPVWAACLRSAFRPTVDDSEAADAARMRWMLRQGKVTSFDTATCRPVFYSATDMNDARREIDKRMAQGSGNT